MLFKIINLLNRRDHKIIHNGTINNLFHRCCYYCSILISNYKNFLLIIELFKNNVFFISILISRIVFISYFYING